MDGFRPKMIQYIKDSYKHYSDYPHMTLLYLNYHKVITQLVTLSVFPMNATQYLHRSKFNERAAQSTHLSAFVTPGEIVSSFSNNSPTNLFCKARPFSLSMLGPFLYEVSSCRISDWTSSETHSAILQSMKNAP
jgi:hypothetical protein